MRLLYSARGQTLHNLIRVGSAVALILFGWDAGVIGGIVNSPVFQHQIHYDGTEEVLTFMVAGILLGDVLGCVSVAPFAYKYGIRWCILVSSYVGIVGVLLQTAAMNPEMMVIGRVLLGVGNGVTTALLPVYMQETSVGSEASRSRDIIFALGCAVYGLAVANWVDYGVLQKLKDIPNLWRFPIAMQALFLIVAVVVYHGLHETPRWLYSKRRDAEADAALCQLLDCSPNDAIFVTQRDVIKASIDIEEAESKEAPSIWTLLFRDTSQTHIGKRIWLGTAIICNNPLYGGNVITFYSASIFAVLNLSVETQNLLTATLQSAAPVGLMFAFYLLPRFGRRPILVYGGTALVSMMTVFTICTNIHTPSAAAMWTAIASLYFFQIIWGACYSWMPNLYSTEIVPTRYRAQAVALGNAVYFFGAFVVTYSTPIAVANTGSTMIFIWFCLMGGGLVALIVLNARETRGLSLEQVDLLWASDEYKESMGAARVIEGQPLGSVHEESTLAEKKL